jgi:serine/threonine-protein kinase HipA
MALGNKNIAVYADWEGLPEALRIGFLHARMGAGRDLFEFEFDRQAINHAHLKKSRLDPRLGLFEGAQYPDQNHATFGMFADGSPDRWGRKLMDRRLEREKRTGAGAASNATRLTESDYLLGVHDPFRVGALRFKLDDDGQFLDHRNNFAAPPFVALRELEAASLALEKDTDNLDEQGDAWLRMLIAPGGSLGGARPKASVVDPAGDLWIAKFPSARDERNVGAWELLVHTLAVKCGLRVPQAQGRQFGSAFHTFLVKRFDRVGGNRRLHFASAMTLTGHKDGDDAASGASYLELADVLIREGAQTKADLRELWSRIVFNMLVSNTDDHLRNHGFILVPGKGWRLSEAFDMNPVPDSHELTLNISEHDNALDLDLARSVAHYFRVSQEDANQIIADFGAIVALWPIIAKALRLSAREQGAMESAFRLAGVRK